MVNFLCPVFSASHVQHISDHHCKFALRPYHVWKYGLTYLFSTSIHGDKVPTSEYGPRMSNWVLAYCTNDPKIAAVHLLRFLGCITVLYRCTWSVCQLVWLVTIVSPANMAELIKMPCGIWSLVGPRNYVLDGNSHPSREGSILRGKGWPIVKYMTLCRELCKNCCSNWDAVWDAEPGSMEPCIRLECTLAPPGEYDWTVYVQRLCTLIPNYSDCLLKIALQEIHLFPLWN